MRVPALAITLIGLLSVMSCTRHDAEAKTPTPPAPKGKADPGAPKELKEIDAAGLRALLQKNKGRPILVNLFASWCTPCRQELPDIDRLQKEHPRLLVIGIDIDEKDADALAFFPTVPKSMTVYRHRAGVTPLLPALKLPNDWNESFPAGWENTIPLTFVYDSKGVFATGAVGQLSAEAFTEIGKLAPTK